MAYSVTNWCIAIGPFNFKDVKAFDKYCLAEPHELLWNKHCFLSFLQNNKFGCGFTPSGTELIKLKDFSFSWLFFFFPQWNQFFISIPYNKGSGSCVSITPGSGTRVQMPSVTGGQQGA